MRVILDGAWGFASGVALTESEAVTVAETAVTVAQVAAKMTSRPVELAPEPVHKDVTWVSSYDVNPLDVPLAEKTGLFAGWTRELLAAEGVDHATGGLQQVQENKYYADLGGSSITQQRVRLEPHLEVHGADATTGAFDSMRTIAPPVGRGWEYLTEDTFDFDAERAALPELLREKLAAPSVHAGIYDLVIHPSNLWLTIHESIGHATELDRALGYEANYAGTSFATYDNLGTLAYGSPVMHVTGDRTVEHGLSTVGYDDEGVQTQSWDIIRDGDPRGLPARPRDGAHLRRRAQRRTLQRLRVRRLPRPHPDPADGQRLAAACRRRPRHRRADQPGRARHLRDRRQVVVDRHAALQLPVHRPAVLPDRGRRAQGPAARRRLPGAPRPTSGARWRQSADRRPTSSAARSTAARPSPVRSPRSATAAPRRCSATSAS